MLTEGSSAPGTMGQCRSANAEVGPFIPAYLFLPTLSCPPPEGLCSPHRLCPLTLALVCPPDPVCETRTPFPVPTQGDADSALPGGALGHVLGPAPPGRGAVGGGGKALSDLWLGAELQQWGWILGSGVGGGPCAFQPSFALLAWPGSWDASRGGAEPP